MRFIVIFFISLFSTACIYGQQIITNPDHYIRSIHEMDGMIYKGLSPKKKSKKLMFLNGVAIDSSGASLGNAVVLNNSNKIYGYETSNDGRKLRFLSISEQAVKQESVVDYLYILPKQYLISDRIFATHGAKLLAIDPLTWQVSELVDISRFSDGYSIIDSFFSPDKKRVLFVCGEHVGGGNDVYGFFVYDLESDKVEDKTNEFRKFLPIDGVTDLPVDISDQISTEKHVYIRILKGANEILDELIIDNSFQPVGKALEKYINVVGVNIGGGKVLSYNVTSFTDSVSVIVRYTPRFKIERSLCKIYYDTILSEQEIDFRRSELELLKNFIFAKHNYKFDNEYYQAYFNLFEFYNDERRRKSRTKEVNHLLSDSDRKNLDLITAALKRAKD